MSGGSLRCAGCTNCATTPRHDLGEMLAIALLSMLSDGRTCVDMSDYPHVAEPLLRRFMKLEHGAPSHDAFSDLFNALDPASPEGQ